MMTHMIVFQDIKGWSMIIVLNQEWYTQLITLYHILVSFIDINLGLIYPQL